MQQVQTIPLIHIVAIFYMHIALGGKQYTQTDWQLGFGSIIYKYDPEPIIKFTTFDVMWHDTNDNIKRYENGHGLGS